MLGRAFVNSSVTSFRQVRPGGILGSLTGSLAAVLLATTGLAASAAAPLRESLRATGFKLAYESYVDDNWEIFVVDADGSNPTNLTKSPQVQEHYPQVSPDGTKICYSVDAGDGREAVRSLWVMNADGTNRRHLVDRAREPFWSPDSQTIGFLPQEFSRFNVVDFYTKGMSFYRLSDGRITEHPNAAKLHHLYNPAYAPNGKWIVSTVHAGMGVDHGILLIEAQGSRILNLKIPGCRPALSPDGKKIAWGSGDHEVVVAPLDTEAPTPAVGTWQLRIQDAELETYHVDWSPDSQYVSVSRGPASKGDPSKKGTFLAACEMVGVYAPGWDLHAVRANREGIVDLHANAEADHLVLTTNGASNKESSWFRPAR